MNKKLALILALILLVIPVTIGLAQTFNYILWSEYCPGVAQLGYPQPGDGGQWVHCWVEDEPVATTTNTSVVPTATQTRTSTLVPTATRTLTATLVPTNTTTFTVTPSQTLASTLTSTATLIPTNTPTSTITPTLTSTPTLVFTNTPTATRTQTQVPTSTPTQVFVSRTVDHNNLNDFNSITPEQILQAQNTKMVFMDRSVGVNVSDGLNCLASQSWQLSNSSCRKAYTDLTMTTNKVYTDYNTAPIEIQFPTGLSRTNWTYDFEYGDWQAMVRDFIQVKVPLYYGQGYRVISFQFSYLNVLTGSNIDEKFFDRSFTGWNIVDLEELEAQYPDVTFVYWTTSLARIIGTPDATSFNNQMRQYAQLNNKYMIDMADIESYNYANQQCLSGVNPIICKDYTTEPDGGHLGSISNGQIKMAKAMWLMMVKIVR